MSRRLRIAVLAFAMVAVLTGCGPSSEEVAAIAAADEAACELAMVQFDRAQGLLNDGIDTSDVEAMASVARELEAVASEAPTDGDRREAIERAAHGLSRWAERGLPLEDGSIPLGVDAQMFLLEAKCSDDILE